ncbi:MAG: glycosyltransferase family 2 protein [Actinomycetota bacterium]|nr:glycosyltransferase family 2 protein [Actinomycetota bacterium]
MGNATAAGAATGSTADDRAPRAPTDTDDADDGRSVGPAGPRPGSRRRAARRAVALVAAVVAVVGHLWIIAVGAASTSPWLFAPVALVLAVGALALPLRLHEGWHDPPELPPAIGATAAIPVDVIVTTVGDPPEQLLETLVSCLALRGDVRVLVADDGTEGAGELAAELGVAHRRRGDSTGARAANLNDALDALLDLPGRPLPAEAVLVVAAGEVVLPDLLERCLLPLAADGVAVVEPGADVLDPDGPAEVADLGRMATWRRSIVAPGLSTVGAGTWWGGGPALVRRSALVAVGGIAEGSLTPELRTGLRLQRLGWRIVTVPGIHARVRRPHDPTSLTTTRQRRSVDRLTTVLEERAFADRRLTGHQRLSYLALLWQAVRATTTLVAVALTVASLVGDVAFIVLDRADLLWPLAATLVAEATMLAAIGRGELRPLDVLRHDLRTSTSAPRALFRAVRRAPPDRRRIDRHGTSPGGLRALGAHPHLVWIVVALEVAALWALARANLDLPGPGARGLVLLVGLGLALVFGVADGVAVAVVDTTSTGLGIAAPVDLDPGPEVAVELTIPRLDAEPLVVHGRARVRHQRVLDDVGVRHLGVELVSPTSSTRVALAAYRAVVHPFALLGRAPAGADADGTDDAAMPDGGRRRRARRSRHRAVVTEP